MNTMLDIRVSDAQMERLWRTFHTAWVGISEDLARAEELLCDDRFDESLLPSQLVLVAMLRSQEKRQREMLDRFVDRMRKFQNDAAALRIRY